MHLITRKYGSWQSCTMWRDFEGGVYWDELAETCGDISRVVGFWGATRFWGNMVIHVLQVLHISLWFVCQNGTGSTSSNVSAILLIAIWHKIVCFRPICRNIKQCLQNNHLKVKVKICTPCFRLTENCFLSYPDGKGTTPSRQFYQSLKGTCIWLLQLFITLIVLLVLYSHKY